MTRRARLAAALAILAAAACVDFVPIPQGLPEAPVGQVQAGMTLLDLPGAADSLFVEVTTITGQPGTTAPAETLSVLGRPLPPEPRPAMQEPVFHRARLGADVAALATSPVTLTLPRPFVTPLAVRFPTRVGPDTLRVPRGGDVALEVRPEFGAPDLPLRYEGWDLSLARGSRSAAFQSTSPLPPRVVIPAALLPGGPGDEIRVTLVARLQTGTGSGAVPGLGALFTSIIEWVVRLEG